METNAAEVQANENQHGNLTSLASANVYTRVKESEEANYQLQMKIIQLTNNNEKLAVVCCEADKYKVQNNVLNRKLKDLSQLNKLTTDNARVKEVEEENYQLQMKIIQLTNDNEKLAMQCCEADKYKTLYHVANRQLKELSLQEFSVLC